MKESKNVLFYTDLRNESPQACERFSCWIIFSKNRWEFRQSIWIFCVKVRLLSGNSLTYEGTPKLNQYMEAFKVKRRNWLFLTTSKVIKLTCTFLFYILFLCSFTHKLFKQCIDPKCFLHWSTEETLNRIKKGINNTFNNEKYILTI